MSRVRKFFINSIVGTLLENKKDLTFEDCLKHSTSFRMCPTNIERELLIYKYIPLKYLLVLLKEKKLIINPVSSWEDPYENFLLKQKFIKPGESEGSSFVTIENLTKGFYGMSWTLQNESDSLWRIYSPDKLSIKISTTVEDLVRIVVSDDDKWGVWMNKVNYKTEDEITEWLSNLKSINDYEQFVGKIGESFFIKRKEFSAEDEYRVIINYRGQWPQTICFPCNHSIFIHSYVIDPRVNTYEYEAIKACLMNFGVDEMKITKSPLYDFESRKVEMEYDPFPDF